MKRKSLVCFALLVGWNIYSQVGIGTREPKGVLEVSSQPKSGSSGIWGLVLPVVDSAEKLTAPDGSSPVEGTLFFNEAAQSLCYIGKDRKAACVVESIKQLATGDDAGYALTENGILYSWGDNSKGQLGRDVNGGNSSENPGKVHFPGNTIISSVIAKRDLAFAIDEEGKLYSWGDSENQQLGRLPSPTVVGDFRPARVPGKVNIASKVESVFIGGDFVIAKDIKGKLYSWGKNARNQLGRANDGNLTGTTPKEIAGLSSSISDVAIGPDFAFVLDQDGKVYSWGNDNGQLGREVNDANKADSPLPVKFPDGVKISSIAAGSDFGLALDTVNGKVYSWGNNSEFQLGRVPDPNHPAEKPGTVISLNDVRDKPSFIVAGPNFSIVLYGKQTLYFLGKYRSLDKNGFPHNFKIENRTFSAVKATPDHVYFLDDSQGFIYSLDIQNIAIGLDPVINEIILKSGVKISSFAVEKNFGYALDKSGTLYSWGRDNSKSQLGRATNRVVAGRPGEIDL